MPKFTVNGVPRNVDVEDDMPLLWVLRDELKIHGPKYGCGVAQCGACTVHMDGEAVKSCQVPAEFIEGTDITTIEGLGTPDALHAVQQAWIEHQVAQCGYCQSGQIMAAAGFLDNWKESYLERLASGIRSVVDEFKANENDETRKVSDKNFKLDVTLAFGLELPSFFPKNRSISGWDSQELKKKSLEAALNEALIDPFWFDSTPKHLDIRVKVKQGTLGFIANKEPKHGDLSDKTIDEAMSSNLCRCGTYPRIRAAVKTAAKKLGDA